MPTCEFTVHRRVLTGKLKPNVHLALLPTTVWWQATALMRFGGWNECPRAAEHAALHRSWGERYDEELVCMRPDVLQFRVARLLAVREQVTELAQQQFDYCNDIVMQG